MRAGCVGTWRRADQQVVPLSIDFPVCHIRLMGQPAFNYRRLPIPERVQLVEDIWDSIAEDVNASVDPLPLTDAQTTELRRRVADADAHPDDVIPWEEVRKELFQRGE